MIMKSSLSIFLVLALFANITRSQTCSDPVRDYLKNNVNPETGELLEGEVWTGHSGAQPPGGYLLRFEAPIGLNASPVLFICLSVLSNQKRSTWSAYTSIDKAKYMLASDSVEFGSIPTFYLLTPKDNGMRGLAEIYTGKETYSVFTYSVDVTGHLQVGNLPGISRNQDEEYSNPLEDKQIKSLLRNDNLNRKYVPRITKVLLAEYLQKPAIDWRPFNPEYGVTSQGADPYEKGVLNTTRGFTQRRASELWKALRD